MEELLTIALQEQGSQNLEGENNSSLQLNIGLYDYLVVEGCCFWLVKNDGCLLQDLTMHINVSSEQHTSAINQLLYKIKNTPESIKELENWGLDVNSKIITVSPAAPSF